MQCSNESLMIAFEKCDSSAIRMYMQGKQPLHNVEINKICSNGKTLLGAAAKTGNLTWVQWLLEFSRSDQLPLDIRNDNHHDMKLELSKSSNSNGTKKKQNIGYFCVCKETEELGEGPTPDGMEGLEWDMEVDQRSKQSESPVQSPDNNLYHWYANILSRTAVILKSPEHDLGRLDRDGFGVLHYATESANIGLIGYLLMNCPVLGIDQPDKTGMTPLHIAVKQSNEATVLYLLNKGANVDAVTHERNTPLHLAARWSTCRIIRMLLDHGAKVNATDLLDRTPISFAVQHGDSEIVKMLVLAGARLSLEEADGSTLLSRAVARDSVSIVSLLLDYGARIINSQFLLHSAARTGNVRMIEVLLIRSFVLINMRDFEGNTPLIVASTYGKAEAVKMLLLNGAMPRFRNSVSGLTALHLCVENVESMDILQDIIQSLVEHGADINQNSYEGTPLWFAVATTKFTAATVLIQNGAKIDLRDERTNYDILSLARRNKADSLVQLFVYAGYNMKNVVTPPKKKEKQFTFMSNIQKSPMPLRDLSRICIRKCIGSQRYISKVHQLPLPKLLQDYLTFQNF